MSQQAVLQILYELGGSATAVEIRKRAEEKFPEYSLSTYVCDRLRKLRKWGLVDYDIKTRKYFIIQQPHAEELLSQS
jgi:Fe2+ or Zn2+ uptake regulation protein